ncbi:MAG: hypothetical protein IPL08_13590 [Saprospiraceae bacterium]|nr:hypothetical protein [Saprospiraceae bacterium]
MQLGINDVINLHLLKGKIRLITSAGKYIIHFVSPEPNTEFIAELSKLFIQSAGTFYCMFKALFKSDHFYDGKYLIGAIIKKIPSNVLWTSS